MGNTVRMFAAGLVLANGLPATAAIAAASEPVRVPTGGTRCSFTAWTSYRVDGPIPVRAAPARTAKILGVLPVSDNGEDYPSSIEFDVVETRPGWLKIDHANDPAEFGEDDKPIPSRQVYQHAGWIPDNALQFGVQSSLGYARPDATSPLILDLGDDWLSDFASIDAVRGCSGEWVLLDYTVHARRTETAALVELPPAQQVGGTAWFRGICSNQHTTCDMASVDRRPGP